MHHDDYEELPIRDEMIRLGQALKLANLAEDGQHAKHLVSEGQVTVNGAVELRRGAQLHAGDVIAVVGAELPPVRIVTG
ncbi:MULTISPECIES: RNA-binding S4 domain-containing protein [Kocuria]|uniref:Ribosome-associated protein n=1 Tax=Kocuria marina subsp. indica TaxID=1049583 RepID=A0A1X7CUG7_9MICC|nr:MULTISPECIES: RNA-binding S4 domain-containing protein [Kocuria]MBN6812084.1 RNA-binding S4 domain-containing protein [Kocuria indica]MBN6843778.1 RNA-binding S4 domain-containing protein [Kocuria indica]MCG7431391.1 RNA-binding S4 domain-containing protein [Kocuria indica]MCT1722919.1 RNA-binding S4 domain-containing protein [Kocuria marina]MCT1734263.1 RNA-binding S4 domain-containing protein [Kocuria marina]